MESSHAAHWYRPAKDAEGGYEVLTGPGGTPTHVAPKQGTEWEPYDPLAEYRRTWDKTGEKHLPYLELTKLDLSANHEIADWMDKYGPLGLLPQFLDAAYFWPRWEKVGIPDEYRINQKGYRRGSIRGVGEGASARFEDLFENMEEDEEEEVREKMNPQDGEPLTDEERRRIMASSSPAYRVFREPGVWLENPRFPGGDRDRLSIAEGYAPFIPDLEGVKKYVASGADPKDHDLPNELEPLALPPDRTSEWMEDENFRRRYGEPLPMVKKTIRVLREFWEVVRADNPRDTSLQDRTFQLRRHSINHILQSIHLSFEPASTWELSGTDPENFVQYRYPSLLAALVHMMVNDLQRPDLSKRYGVCEHCESRFIKSRSDDKFCSNQGPGNCMDAYHNARR